MLGLGEFGLCVFERPGGLRKRLLVPGIEAGVRQRLLVPRDVCFAVRRAGIPPNRLYLDATCRRRLEEGSPEGRDGEESLM